MKRGLVVSDFQVGSVFGILPPNFLQSDGTHRTQNVGQQYLWQCWQDFCHRAKAFDPDFVIVNGDVVDGPQPAQHGTELCLNLMADQQSAAEVVLNGLKTATPHAKWYFVQGTEYHVGKVAYHEEMVARALGAEKYWSVGMGVYCREVLWLDVEGVIIEVSHHIPPTVGFYRATALDREMQWSAITGKDAAAGVPKADLLIRAHVHYFLELQHPSKQGFITPCWQLQTRFMRKGSAYRMLPTIGGVMFTVDGQAKKAGRKPCQIMPELYQLPPVTPTIL